MERSRHVKAEIAFPLDACDYAAECINKTMQKFFHIKKI